MDSPSEPANNSKPFVAAFASAIMPGIGQFIAGDARRGRTLIVIDAAVLIVMALLFREQVSMIGSFLVGSEDSLTLVMVTLAKPFVQPTVLVLMMVANLLLLGYRVWAADDAYQIAKADSGTVGAQRTTILLGATLIGAVLLIPHAAFGYYDLTTYEGLTSVFSGGTVTADTTATTQPAPPATDATGDTVVTVPPETTTTAPSTEVFTGDDRLNILLIGGDFGEGRTGIRTDTMITVSIDPTTGETAMFSVPRNWTYAPLPEGMGVWDCNCYPELINELWVMGEQYPSAFPGPGTPSENAVKGVIGEFLGLDIDYYAMVNLDGFVDIVDALGGVNIYIPSKVVDEAYPHEDGTVERIEIDQGWQKLDGHLALAYARTRNQDSDYFRMNRQRCVIEAMVKEANPTSLILNFGKFTDVIKQTMETDIPIDALPELIEILPSVDLDNVVSVRFIPPDYHLKYRDDGKPGAIANVDLVHEHVQLVIEDPARAVEELGLEQLEDVCGDPNA